MYFNYLLIDRLIDRKRERERDDSCVYLLAASACLSLQTIKVNFTSNTAGVDTVLLTYREEKSIFGVRSQAFSSLRSLQRWKADPIRYLHGSYFLPFRSAGIFLFSFLSAISIFLLLGSAVHWTLSPPYHE